MNCAWLLKLLSVFTVDILYRSRQQHMCHMHRHWVTMAISSLPYVGNALRPLATSIVNQTCRNLELLAVEYTRKGEPFTSMVLSCPIVIVFFIKWRGSATGVDEYPYFVSRIFKVYNLTWFCNFCAPECHLNYHPDLFRLFQSSLHLPSMTGRRVWLPRSLPATPGLPPVPVFPTPTLKRPAAFRRTTSSLCWKVILDKGESKVKRNMVVRRIFYWSHISLFRDDNNLSLRAS